MMKYERIESVQTALHNNYIFHCFLLILLCNQKYKICRNVKFVLALRKKLKIF